MSDAIGPGSWITTTSRPDVQAMWVSDWTTHRQTSAGGVIQFILTKSGRLLRPEEADIKLTPWYDTYAAALAAGNAWMMGTL